MHIFTGTRRTSRPQCPPDQSATRSDTSANSSPAEAAHFQAWAPHWWDLQGPCRLLHQLNPVRLQFISDRILLPQKKILDIGCGGGILSQSLAERGAKVVGIDIVPELIAVATTQAINTQQDHHLQYTCSTAEDYAQQYPGTFDVITCMELLEHVPNPASLIHSCLSLLKPGGHLFVSTINRHPKAYVVAILAAEYFLKALPEHTHHYAQFIRPSELAHWLGNSPYSIQTLKGISYNPLTRAVKLSADVSVNYIAHICTSEARS